MVGAVVLAGMTSLVVCTTSWGRTVLAASRLFSTIALTSSLASAMLTAPLPVTSGVTPTEVHPEVTKAPLEPVTVADRGGALSAVIFPSTQMLLATARTSYPTVELLEEFTRR